MTPSKSPGAGREVSSLVLWHRRNLLSHRRTFHGTVETAMLRRTFNGTVETAKLRRTFHGTVDMTPSHLLRHRRNLLWHRRTFYDTVEITKLRRTFYGTVAPFMTPSIWHRRTLTPSKPPSPVEPSMTPSKPSMTTTKPSMTPSHLLCHLGENLAEVIHKEITKKL